MLWWKTTFDGRSPSMKDYLQWKTTFDGRRPSMEDNLQWKKTFHGRQPSMQDNLWWKTIPIMFLSVLGLLRPRSDYCHRVAIFKILKGIGEKISPLIFWYFWANLAFSHAFFDLDPKSELGYKDLIGLNLKFDKDLVKEYEIRVKTFPRWFLISRSAHMYNADNPLLRKFTHF